MQEKGTDTDKKEIKTNSDLFLFDDAYHKVKAQQKSIRCKSANINKKVLFNSNNLKTYLTKRKEESYKDKILNSKRFNFFKNDLLKKETKVRFLSPKSRNKLNSNMSTINISSNIFNSNDSFKLDTTKQSSLTRATRILSGKYNSSISLYKSGYSIQRKNKNNIKSRNKNEFSVININGDNFHTKKRNINKKTLEDLTIQNLIKKSKTIDLNKISKTTKHKNNIEKKKIFDFYHSFLSDRLNHEKKFDIDNNIVLKKDKGTNMDFSIINQNYPIKYSFLDENMNNILHMVNFVDVENREELLKNVRIDLKDKDRIKFEDFKTIGSELCPEILYKINQDEKQRLIKLKYEELKNKYKFENSQNIKEKKLLRTKFKKNYVPEYKLKFKNDNWKNKNYESIYKFHSIKYIPTPKKKEIQKKKFIKNKSIEINPKKTNSFILFPKKSKILENIIKRDKNEKKSNSIQINKIENTRIKSALQFNENKINQNYINKSKENINNNKISDNLDINDKSNSKNNNNNEISNIEKNMNQKESTNNNIDESNNNISSNINMNPNGFYKIINQKQNYNKINKIVKIDYIFLKGDEYAKYENLDISDYVNEINSKRNYKKRNTFSSLQRDDDIPNTKIKTMKDSSNISIYLRARHKTFLHRNSLKKPPLKLLNFQKGIFKSKEENKSNINNNNKLHESKKKIIKKEKNEVKNIINEINENDNLEEMKNDKNIQKIIFENIDNENKFHIEKNSFIPFSDIKNKSNEGFNKIQINFFATKNKKINKLKPRKKSKNKKEFKKLKEEVNIIKKDMIKNEKINIEDEKKSETINKSDERLSIIRGRRMNKSATLEYINKKYKEIEKQKGNVDINEELSENLDKLNYFKNTDLESVEDIEYNKNVLLYKLKEDIRYNITIGKCEKAEMDEFIRFENKINEYKIKYNLKDKDKIKEYVLLLLVKFNEFMELLSVRERRKMEENRVNKFINNLNYDLDYNIPLSLIVKGRRCFSRNYNENISRLSEIKK